MFERKFECEIECHDERRRLTSLGYEVTMITDYHLKAVKKKNKL